MGKKSNANPHDSTEVLLLGLCSQGPYRHAVDNIQNPALRWINWGYNAEYVDPEVLQAIKIKKIRQGTKVVFSNWALTKESQGRLLRRGVIDHIAYRRGYLALTIFLEDAVSGTVRLPASDHLLCRFVGQPSIRMDCE